MTLGEKIRALRKEKGMTQGDLADKINSTKQTIYKYENDLITNIPYEKLSIIAEALDATPTQLMGWDEIAARAGRKAAEEYMQSAGQTESDPPEDARLQRLLDYYHALNEAGQEEALERIEELSYIPRYQNIKDELYRYVKEVHEFMREHNGNITEEDGQRIMAAIAADRKTDERDKKIKH